jgi:hypothetical protein
MKRRGPKPTLSPAAKILIAEEFRCASESEILTAYRSKRGEQLLIERLDLKLFDWLVNPRSGKIKTGFATLFGRLLEKHSEGDVQAFAELVSQSALTTREAVRLARLL